MQNSPPESKEASLNQGETQSNLRQNDQEQAVVNKTGTDYLNSIIIGIIAVLGFLIFRRLFLVTMD